MAVSWNGPAPGRRTDRPRALVALLLIAFVMGMLPIGLAQPAAGADVGGAGAAVGAAAGAGCWQAASRPRKARLSI